MAIILFAIFWFIGLMVTGDIIIDKSYMSTYEKDKSYDFSYNILQFENKVKELKQN